MTLAHRIVYSFIKTSPGRPLGRARFSAVVFAAVASAQAPTTSLVDVAGRKVNVQVAGTSKRNVPTVVFESGFGTPVAVWKPIQSDIAALTSTIAYDRAGTGASEVATAPRTVKQLATELHALLVTLGAPPPYVLVGHSWGGPIIHTFAGMFPKEVAGLVYIDPTDFMQTEADMQAVFDKAGVKGGHAAMEEMTKPMSAGASPGLRAENGEIERAAREGFISLRDVADPPDVPLSVLLSTRLDGLPPTFPGIATRYVQATVDQRVDHFSSLVRRSANGHLVMTTNSGHFVHVAEPELVTSEIRDVLSAATSHPELQRFVGQYQVGPTFFIAVTREGNNLFMRPTAQPRVQLFAVSPTVFSLRVVDATVEFDTNAAGEVSALTIAQNGHRQRVLRSHP
jgi:pimeloyl-ACP methyl ester carboxylesterase